MSSPLVSILIPVYNRKKYIAECIQSAIDQTFTDHEIVVVDNASDDGTWEICQQFADLDPRVRVFRNEKNIGPVRNWISCAHEARGEYSKILFSDDLLETDCIARMLQCFDNPAVGLVFCAARIGESKNKSIITYSVKNYSLIDQKQYLSLLLRNRAPVSPGAALVRTMDLIANLHTNFPTSIPRAFEQHGAGPDVMLMMLTTKSYPKIMHLPKPLVFFRAHKDSFSVINRDNEIVLSYVSVFAYFLKKEVGIYHWMTYIVRLWLTLQIQDKSFVNPARLLKSFEGDGSIKELLYGIILTPCVILVNAFRFLRIKLEKLKSHA